jgi:predicted GTPase
MRDLILVPSGFIIEKRHIFLYQLNILTCRKPGLGKSSFINRVLKEKRAKKGEGLSIINDIVRYSHPYFPIIFYDTPGADSSEAIKMLNDKLELYNIKLQEAKNKYIWFCGL